MKTNKLLNKNFILIVIGQIISLFGNGILRFALPLYLLNVTGSSAIFGMVSAISFLPLVLLMPMGGIIADRANKKNIMVILDFITGLLMFTFYLLLDKITLVPLFIVTMMILYSISGLYQPTVQASIPLILNETILAKGNGIVSSIGALSNLLSPIIGGLLFGVLGIKPIIIVSIICFFASSFLEIFIKISYKKLPQNKSIWSLIQNDTSLCVTFIFKEKTKLKKLMFITCILNAFLSSMLLIALPVLITERLNLSEQLYGFSQASFALGGLFGGILTGIFGKKLNIEKLYKCFIMIAISLIPFTISMLFVKSSMISFILIVISSFLVMSITTVVSVMIITYVQEQTNENMQGRVMAFLMSISICSQPLGQVIYGIAFEYLIGFESLIILGSIFISIFAAIYTKKIFIK